MENCDVLVIGDGMIDEYVSCTRNNLIMPAYSIDSRTVCPGGAANVAVRLGDLKLAAKLICTADFADHNTVIAGYAVNKFFLYHKDHVLQTSIKTYIYAGNVLICRIDSDVFSDTLSISAVARYLRERDLKERPSIVLFVDYNKGLLPPLPTLLEELVREEATFRDFNVIVNYSGTSERNSCREQLLAYKQIPLNLTFVSDSSNAKVLTGTFSYKDALRTLIDVFGLAVVTRGAKGAAYMERGETGVFSIKAHSTNSVDSVGAGDAFIAGWCYGLIRNWDAQLCMQLAQAAASESLGMRGTCGALLFDNVLDRFNHPKRKRT